MAAARSSALLIVLCGFVTVSTIKDGVKVSQCNYPGVVALVSTDNKVILCNGIRADNVLYIPQLCYLGLKEALTKVTVKMFYGDGTNGVIIPADSEGTLTDGVYKMTIPGPMLPDCNYQALLYQKDMKVNYTTCEVAGYGDDEVAGKVYDGVLQAATLVESTSEPCCRVIFDSLTEDQKGSLVDENVSLNCGASTGAACGIADLGGPVYCKRDDDVKVVVGLVASSPCETHGRFLIHDLTKGADFKFGFDS